MDLNGKTWMFKVITWDLEISGMLLITNMKFQDSVTTIPVGILYNYKDTKLGNVLYELAREGSGTLNRK